MAREAWRVGIVGCGRIAGLKDQPRESGPIGTHAQAYWRHPDFQLTAAVSLPVADARRFQEIWSVPQVYTSLDEMLAQESLEVISICSPDACHFPQARQILESPHRPRLLFIEKPVCLAPDELAALTALSRQTGVAVMVDHTRRFDPAHCQAAQLARSGRLGALISGRGVYYGGWLHNGVHLIDTLLMCLREEPVIISSRRADTGKPGDPDLDLTLALGKATITLESFDETYYQLFEIELRFEAGRLLFVDFGCRVDLEEVQVNSIGERELKPLPGSPLRGLASPLFEAVSTMAAWLGGQNPLPDLGVDLSSAARTMKLVWQAKEMGRS